ncbi:hypothetical protein ACS0PU_008413 [Formica fusca]
MCGQRQDMFVVIHVPTYVFIKISTVRRHSAIDHRGESKFVYPYVYLLHTIERVEVRARIQVSRTRNLAASLYISPKKMNEKAQNYEAEIRIEDREKTVAPIRSGSSKLRVPQQRV